MATGNGLQLVRTVTGKTASIRPYFVPATYGTALFVGDPVRLISTTGTMDALNEVPCVAAAATGEIILGVIVGFEPDAANLLSANYKAASKARYVLVCDDPDAVYQVQEDAVGGAVTAALVGAMANANFVVAAGSTVTGLSGVMLDSSTTTASAADLKIIGVARDSVNAAAASGGAVLEVTILSSAIKATDSQS